MAGRNSENMTSNSWTSNRLLPTRSVFFLFFTCSVLLVSETLQKLPNSLRSQKVKRQASEAVHDPRIQKKCYGFYGRRGNDVANPIHVWTTEDIIARRIHSTNSSSERGPFIDELGNGPRANYHAKLGSPYGKAVFLECPGNGTVPAVAYIEIPKTGSSTMKRYFCLGGSIESLKKDPATMSFTVVREPLERFISGWGTIKNRRWEVSCNFQF